MPKWKKNSTEFTVGVSYSKDKGVQTRLPKPVAEALGEPESVTFVLGENGIEVKSGEAQTATAKHDDFPPKDTIIKKLSRGTMMGNPEQTNVSTFPPSVLLGRSLNDVERKYAPKILYAAGRMQIPIPRPRVAIVGSRKASDESLGWAETITKALVEEKVVIVSGLAKGIDTAAHTTALRFGGKTLAVLGTPLDRVYPAENADLQAEIMQNHLAVSQFPTGHKTLPRDFVIRNRTMALIADASVIVQAGESSGSISQGYEALRLGRPLFIWKDLMDSSLSWPKEMSKYGAMRLSDPKDLLENLPSSRSVLEITR